MRPYPPFRRRPHCRPAARALAALGAATATMVLASAACTEVGSDPSAAVAIELDPTQLPALVIGDSLRDSTGKAVPLAARAFNSRNAVIPDAPIRFLAIDTGFVAVDSITGFVVGRKVGNPQVIASVGGLQSTSILVHVTLRPDHVRADTLVQQTLQFSLTNPNAQASGSLRVYVGHDTVIAGKDTSVGVENYLVRYRIVAPTGDTVSLTDTTKLVLTSAATDPRPSAIDTTDNGGKATRVVRISTGVRIIPDSVVVDAIVSRPNGTPLPGSPVRFTIKIVKGGALRSRTLSEEP